MNTLKSDNKPLNNLLPLLYDIYIDKFIENKPVQDITVKQDNLQKEINSYKKKKEKTVDKKVNNLSKIKNKCKEDLLMIPTNLNYTDDSENYKRIYRELYLDYNNNYLSKEMVESWENDMKLL